MGRLPSVKPQWDTPPLLADVRPWDALFMRAGLSTDASPIARAVFARMVDAQMTQKALALKANLNETYVRDLFKGKSKNPKQEQLVKLAGALSCRVADLIQPPDTTEIDALGLKQEKPQFIDDPDELALLGLWRAVLPETKHALLAIAKTSLIGTSIRKSDDI